MIKNNFWYLLRLYFYHATYGKFTIHLPVLFKRNITLHRKFKKNEQIILLIQSPNPLSRAEIIKLYGPAVNQKQPMTYFIEIETAFTKLRKGQFHVGGQGSAIELSGGISGFYRQPD